MKINVTKYAVEPQVSDGGTKGSYGAEVMEFTFSEEWLGLERTITFFPPKGAAKCVWLTSDTIPLPAEVTARAGRTTFVLCGARAGQALITVSGVIQVADTILPTGDDVTDRTPGAVEQITLACSDAQISAKSAAESAQVAANNALSAGSYANRASDYLREMREYGEQMQQSNAPEVQFTNENRYAVDCGPSMAAVTGLINGILSALCPLRITVWDSDPPNPADDQIYLIDGVAKCIEYKKTIVTMYRWYPTYIEGAGPAIIYTDSANPAPGDTVYWQGEEGTYLYKNLNVYTTVDSIDNGRCICSYGIFDFNNRTAIEFETEDESAAWKEVEPTTDLSRFFAGNAGEYAILQRAAISDLQAMIERIAAAKDLSHITTAAQRYLDATSEEDSQ